MGTPPLDLRTRLRNAIQKDDTEAAIDCLQRGLDPEVWLETCGGDRTIPAFNLCVRLRRMDIMEALVQAGCSVNRRALDGTTPLFDACTMYRSWPIASYLLSKGAKVNALDADGNTPLLAAAVFGRLSLEMLSGLLEAGSDVNCHNDAGLNVLHVFLTKRYRSTGDDKADLVERLLSTPYRCDVNAATSQGCTPLNLAALFSSSRSARKLIRAGCALECEDTEKITPMGYALKNKRYHLIELLAAAGVLIPRLEWIKLRESLKDDPERLISLLEVGADFPKLSNLCRRAFYEYFGAEARTRVENLPLGPMIKRYLAFEIL